MADLHPPKEIAAGAVDRLCAYDAVGAPGDYAATSERVAEFLAEFVLVLGPRLEAVAKAKRPFPEIGREPAHDSSQTAPQSRPQRVEERVRGQMHSNPSDAGVRSSCAASSPNHCMEGRSGGNSIGMEKGLGGVAISTLDARLGGA